MVLVVISGSFFYLDCFSYINEICAKAAENIPAGNNS